MRRRSGRAEDHERAQIFRCVETDEMFGAGGEHDQLLARLARVSGNGEHFLEQEGLQVRVQRDLGFVDQQGSDVGIMDGGEKSDEVQNPGGFRVGVINRGAAKKARTDGVAVPFQAGGKTKMGLKMGPDPQGQVLPRLQAEKRAGQTFEIQG